ncbi:MAG: SCP2 sterol-binding domain-containing protein [Jatrophihabitantaceae bacterium]
MATTAECERAFRMLADRLANADQSARKKAAFDRTLTCKITDIDVIFGGRLRDGSLTDIKQVDKRDAQVRMSMTSDDLIKLVAGELNMASAWASGRVKIDANVFDLLKLRSVF